MPGKYLVLNDGMLVIERWVGTISHAELLSHEQQHVQDTSIASGAKVLIDARLAEFPETTDALIREISDLYEDPVGRARVSVCAALFRSDHFERAKLWEAEARRHGVRAVVCSGFDVACAYLGLDPTQTRELIESIEL